MRDGLSKAEKQWVARLNRTINAMPETLEIVAYERRLNVCMAGAMRTFLDTESGWGTAEYEAEITGKRIYTHGECV